MVTRKSRNRQQCSRQRGCFDKHCGTMTTTYILEKVADGRTKKEMKKVSAVVDSGAEANALPENMMQWIPLKPSREREIPSLREARGR